MTHLLYPPLSLSWYPKDQYANTMSVDLLSRLSDPDSGDSHTFSIDTSSTFSDYFAMDADGHTLHNALELDLEAGLPSPVTVVIVVTDSGGKTATSKVRVTLEDVNDNDPEFQTTSFSGLYTGMAGATTIGTVTATDDDSGTNAEIDYAIVPGSSSPADKFMTAQRCLHRPLWTVLSTR
nr:hypothetical protein BaRGS_014622 [Batillaria attramentaria]